MTLIKGNTIYADDVITKGVIRDIRAYNGDLATAVSDIGSQEVTLLISQPVTLNQDLTIPENICLKFLKGCPITVETKSETTETIGTGDGSITSFNYIVTDPPIARKSISISYTIGGTDYVVNDGGNGTINGTNLSGTVDYLSGQINLTFSTAPDDGTNIMITYKPAYLLTINGHVEAGLWQIFDGDGEVTGSPKIEAVYPEWLGAVGDGEHDDTEAIQRAFSLLSYGGCNTLELSVATYLMSGMLDFSGKSGLRIIGKGDNSVLKAAPGYDGSTDYLIGIQNPYDGYDTSPCYDCYFANFVLDGNEAKQTRGVRNKLVRFGGGEVDHRRIFDSHFVNVKIRDEAGRGGFGIYGDNNVIINCKAENIGTKANDSSCFHVLGNNNLIMGCRAYNPGLKYTTGFDVTGNNIRVIGNYSGGGARGIILSYEHESIEKNIISGNTIIDPIQHGIVIGAFQTEGETWTLRDVIIQGNCISVSEDTDNIYDSKSGIYITGVNGNDEVSIFNLELSDNTLKGCTDRNGVYLYFINGLKLRNNTIYNFGRNGIYLVDGIMNAEISSNKVYNNGYSNDYIPGIYITSQEDGQGTSRVMVLDNQVFDDTENSTRQYYGIFVANRTNIEHIKIINNDCWGHIGRNIVVSPFPTDVVVSYKGGIITFSDGDTTPSVDDSNIFKTSNSSATSITTFNNGVAGQEITVIFGDSNTTVVHGSGIYLKGGTNVTPSANTTMKFVYDGQYWYEV